MLISVGKRKSLQNCFAVTCQNGTSLELTGVCMATELRSQAEVMSQNY